LNELARTWVNAIVVHDSDDEMLFADTLVDP
jgi:hypothetical protein